MASKLVKPDKKTPITRFKTLKRTCNQPLHNSFQIFDFSKIPPNDRGILAQARQWPPAKNEREICMAPVCVTCRGIFGLKSHVLFHKSERFIEGIALCNIPCNEKDDFF